MLPICNICLRTDRKLRTVDEKLESFYDDICNFNNESGFRACSICIYKLKKCYEFKKNCLLAVTKLKIWKKQKASTRRPIHVLYKDLPTPISLSNPDKCKIFIVKQGDIESQNNENTVVPEKTETLNIEAYSEENKDIEVYTHNNDVKEEVIYEDVEEHNILHREIISTNDSKSLDLKKEPENQISCESDRDYLSDSDESIKELITKIKQNKLTKKKSINKNSRVITWFKNKTFDIQELELLLKDKFKQFGEVKGVKGNILSLDTILKNLDKYSDHNLYILKMLCQAPGPFKPNAIKRLSLVNDRFAGYETIFDIKYLNTEAQMEEEFTKRNQYPDYLRAEFHCEKCVKGFRKDKTLQHHIKERHNDSLPYMCTLCKCYFLTKQVFNRHTLTEHSMVYTCKICPNYITNARNMMLKHYEKHKGMKSVCNQCGKEYVNKSSFYLHINTAHVAPNICKLCACAFHNERGLARHQAMKHNGEVFVTSEENIKCEICDILFPNNEIYTKHLDITHTAKETRNRAPNNDKPRKVIRRKDFKRVFACKLCDWQGDSNRSREEHHLEVHPTEDMQLIYRPNRFLCHTCGKGFNIENLYKYHMNKHNGIRPYSCPKCNKKFFNPINLNTHIERHNPPKYQCKYCEKKFTTKVGLGSHLRMHKGDRRYKCEICGKGFLFPAALKEHINGVHFQIRRKRKPCANDD